LTGQNDPLTELERLHEAAGEPIVATFDESLVVDYITITVGGVRVDELPESEQDALARFAMALLNNSGFLLKQARLAATLTSILCTGEGQDVVGRAKEAVEGEGRAPGVEWRQGMEDGDIYCTVCGRSTPEDEPHRADERKNNIQADEGSNLIGVAAPRPHEGVEPSRVSRNAARLPG
jgi:hypothetical protein